MRYLSIGTLSPPTIRLIPRRKPSATRTSGGMRSCSKEYLTKNATPRNSARPPSQAKSFAPMNCSQLIAGRTGAGVPPAGMGGTSKDAGRSGGGSKTPGCPTGGGGGGQGGTGRLPTHLDGRRLRRGLLLRCDRPVGPSRRGGLRPQLRQNDSRKVPHRHVQRPDLILLGAEPALEDIEIAVMPQDLDDHPDRQDHQDGDQVDSEQDEKCVHSAWSAGCRTASGDPAIRPAPAAPRM